MKRTILTIAIIAFILGGIVGGVIGWEFAQPVVTNYRTIYIVDEGQEQITKITRDITFKCPAYNIETITFENSLCREWISDKNGDVVFIYTHRRR